MSDERSQDGPNGDGPRDGWLDRLMHRFSLKSRESIRDDLEEVLAEATQDAEFSPEERAMLKNVLGLHRVRVSDVMVPRADILAVASATPLGELLSIFRTAGHSRLPTFGETLDEPLGMVHIRDLLDHLTTSAGGPDGTMDLGRLDLSATLASARILRPVLFVPRSMPAIDLLVRMQASRTHIALVIDEYGGTDGLVSMEDLVESIVGDIEDEHDESAVMIARDERGGYVADARASLEEVSEAIGIDLSADIEADEVDTLGGLIVTRAGRVPSRGELIPGPGDLEFEVLDADPRRLKRLRIDRRPAIAASAEPGAPAAPDGATASKSAGP